ncbi:MAG: tRNA pseudouridine(38-40) synthase TruA [Rickettsiales bacterium]|nr:tRNA pseudouridine(38-40) synthase TruA [Rickettsiales bacterium]
MSTRYKLTIEYDGTPYYGWGRQDDVPSVQEHIERAIFKFCQEEVTIACAGRTDKGVHAAAQVAHVDLAKDTDAFRLSEALNFHLKDEPIVILHAEEVSDEFHARFSAIGRRYRYRIINRRPPLAIENNRAWHVAYDLDADAMHEAAQILVGHHDFSSFRASACQAKSPEKTLDRLDVRREGDEIIIEAAARSFLHHQVRNMVGTIERVGAERWTLADVEKALHAKDRKAGGPTAPASGLTLMRIIYDEAELD